MVDELVAIARKCDRRNKWTDEEWDKAIRNCIEKNQYLIKIRGKGVVGFSCWVFIDSFDRVEGSLVEIDEGKIAYILCAYAEEKGILKYLLKEGLKTKHPKVEKIFWYNDKRNDKKNLFKIK